MKFLEKFEDAINAFLEKLGSGLWKKLTALVPHIFYEFKDSIKSFTPKAKEKMLSAVPKIKLVLLKLKETIQHYLHLIKGMLHAFILYLKSDDFKQANKFLLLIKPFKKLQSQFIQNPFKTAFTLSSVFAVIFGVMIITKEASHVANELKALRAPASSGIVAEEDIWLDLGAFNLKKISHENHNEVAAAHGAPASAADHGAPAPAAAHGAAVETNTSAVVTGPEIEAEKFEPKPFTEIELIPLAIKLKFENSKIKNTIESDHQLMHNLTHAIKHIGVPETITLPLETTDKEMIVKNFESEMKKDESFKNLFKLHFSWEIDQEEIKKPRYHLATLRQYKFENMSLQLLLEDTKRNKQVYIEFIAQTRNREGVQILKHHDVEIKDYLMMNVEPVVPGLPLDDEGKRIIKDKIKFEINNYLNHHHLETEVEEIFLDYILAS